jgi:hypothetical protein
MSTAHHHAEGPDETDRDNIQRLYADLWRTVRASLDRGDASHAVIATACGQFVAHTFAGLSATSDDTIDHARRRLDLALDAFETSFWQEFQRLGGAPERA